MKMKREERAASTRIEKKKEKRLGKRFSCDDRRKFLPPCMGDN